MNYEHGKRMRENEHTDIWVIDLRQEAHLGRCHGVFLRQKELQFKLSSFVRRIHQVISVINLIRSTAHVRMDYLLGLLLSHQSISGYHHAVGLKSQVQDPQQDVLFPIKKEMKR